MKFLSCTQPFATLMAIRAKKIETRSWHTAYRGPLGVHAAKGFPAWAMALCYEEPFKSALRNVGILSPEDLPRGVLLAKGILDDCQYIGRLMGVYAFEVGEPELSFGDYTPGRYAWLLDGMEPLPEPIPYKGSLGLFEVTL